MDFGLTEVDEIEHQPAVWGGVGVVLFVMEAGVEVGIEVVYSGEPGRSVGEKCGGAGVFVVYLREFLLEIVDGILAGPVSAVVSAKELYVWVLVLQGSTEEDELYLLLLVGTSGFQDNPHVMIIRAVHEFEPTVKVYSLILHEAVTDYGFLVTVKPYSQIIHTDSQQFLSSYVNLLATSHPKEGAHPPATGAEV